MTVTRAMLAYDDWVFGRVEATLLWLEEWCSISQKTVERSLIVVYLGLMEVPQWWFNPTHTHIVVSLCGGLIVASIFWSMHRRPSATRYGMRLPFVLKVARIWLQLFAIILSAGVIAEAPRESDSYTHALAQIVIVVFLYSTCIGSNGERGRRRKLALAELKKMFGTEWMPKPVPVQG